MFIYFFSITKKKKTKKQNCITLGTVVRKKPLFSAGHQHSSESQKQLTGDEAGRASVWSPFLSRAIANVISFFFCFFFFCFFKKCSLGEELQASPVGAFQSCRILQTRCYKEKIAAKRAELSRMIEDWHRPAELTSLRAGSGDSWPMPSEAREMELNIFIFQFDGKVEKKSIRHYLM